MYSKVNYDKLFFNLQYENCFSPSFNFEELIILKITIINSRLKLYSENKLKAEQTQTLKKYRGGIRCLEGVIIPCRPVALTSHLVLNVMIMKNRITSTDNIS